MTAAIQKLRTFDVSKMSAVLAKAKRGYGEKVRWWKPEAGEHHIRILPPKVGADHDAIVTTKQHFITFPGWTKSLSFICFEEAGEPCPGCSISRQFFDRKNEKDRKTAISIMAKSRSFCNLLVRGEEDKGAQAYGFGNTVLEQIADIMSTYKRDITHPMKGFDLILTKKGSGMGTSYSVLAAMETSVVDPAVFETCYDLNDFTSIPEGDRKEEIFRALQVQEKKVQALPVSQGIGSELDPDDSDDVPYLAAF